MQRLLQRNNGHELYKSDDGTRKMNVRSSQNRSRLNPEGFMEKPLKSDHQTLKQGTPKSPRRQGMCPHKGLSEQWGLSSEATEVRRSQRIHSRCWKQTIEIANKKILTLTQLFFIKAPFGMPVSSQSSIMFLRIMYVLRNNKEYSRTFMHRFVCNFHSCLVIVIIIGLCTHVAIMKIAYL